MYVNSLWTPQTNQVFVESTRHFPASIMWLEAKRCWFLLKRCITISKAICLGAFSTQVPEIPFIALGDNTSKRKAKKWAWTYLWPEKQLPRSFLQAYSLTII